MTIAGVMDVAAFFILPAVALAAGLAAFWIRSLTWGRYLGTGAAACVLLPAVVFLVGLSGAAAPAGTGYGGKGPDWLDVWVVSVANSVMASAVILIMAVLLAGAAALRSRSARPAPRHREAPAG